MSCYFILPKETINRPNSYPNLIIFAIKGVTFSIFADSIGKEMVILHKFEKYGREQPTSIPTGNDRHVCRDCKTAGSAVSTM